MSAPGQPLLLLLGDTTESRLLSAELADAFPGWRVSTFIAGGEQDPGEREGQGHVEAFDSADSMAAWITQTEVTAVIDATHPFANPTTADAAQACEWADVPILRLERPAREEGADDHRRNVGGRPALPDGIDVASSVPEALLWLASVTAAVAREQGRAQAEAAQAEAAQAEAADAVLTHTVDPEAALRALGLPLSGDVERTLAALRSGQAVDIDNAAGWPLPDLGPSAGAVHPDAVARVLLTDMAPEVAQQFTPGFPTLVVSAPSLVVGVEVGEGTTAADLVSHVRTVLGDNLLALESVVALATAQERVEHDAVAGASRQMGVPVLGFTGDVLAAVDAPAPRAAVVVAGAQLVVPEHTASWPQGPSAVAVWRLDAHSTVDV